jgi:uncharacterized membrane protein HdeD (DUF308 family)
MTTPQSILLRKIWLWVLIIACGLVAMCVGFISIVSIWIGVNHTQQTGFWVPVLSGILSFAIMSWLFLWIKRRLLRQIKEEDLVNL